jgi:hypothetical protein
MIDDQRHRRAGERVGAGQQRGERRDHLDVPVHRVGDLCDRAEGLLHAAQREAVKLAVEVDTQAAHAAPGEIGQRLVRSVRRINHRDPAPGVAQRIERIERRGIVGAVKARLHDHETGDAALAPETLQGVDRRNAGKILPFRDLGITARRTDNVNVTVDAHAYCLANSI